MTITNYTFKETLHGQREWPIFEQAKQPRYFLSFLFLSSKLIFLDWEKICTRMKTINKIQLGFDLESTLKLIKSARVGIDLLA